MSATRPARALSVDGAESEVMAARQQLTETIDSLSRSFSSSALIERLVELDPHQGRAQLGSLLRVARSNPVPFLLIGAGLATLLMKPVVRKGIRKRRSRAALKGKTSAS